ncbi:M15 family metallopeptidase [Roseimicrobium sp. ORNL1]|uniref:M15 family metallopeptidase n=1 Tax=Roseimicrobium sp. ORNL1 TaxID=2711231 RepID=UPI0013E11273|nr:M15 family metallopeptidase [Roseimicrobium sp. ORNL1]QIF02736.1 M15 family metallopeptidase [Roseimicrobium sp. ORNL1]
MTSLPRRLPLVIVHLVLLSALPLTHRVTADDSQPAPPPSPSSFKPGHEFVEVSSVIPGIVISLPYATEQNFFKKRFYASNTCLLRRSVVDRLAAVQKELGGQGLGLKIWDGYRPRSVQYEFWKTLPDPNYVADPAKGSRHNRGAAVDLTLIDLKTGTELPMPTGYDDFSPKAAADFKLVSPEALKNRALLQQVMVKHGFEIFPSEWWHFDAKGWEEFPLENFSPDDYVKARKMSQKSQPKTQEYEERDSPKS